MSATFRFVVWGSPLPLVQKSINVLGKCLSKSMCQWWKTIPMATLQTFSVYGTLCYQSNQHSIFEWTLRLDDYNIQLTFRNLKGLSGLMNALIIVSAERFTRFDYKLNIFCIRYFSKTKRKSTKTITERCFSKQASLLKISSILRKLKFSPKSDIFGTFCTKAFN